MDSIKNVVDEFKPVVVSASTTQVQMFEPTEKTRPDVNIGKWAGWIFSSPRSKDLEEVKEYQWELQGEGGSVTSSIRVTPMKGRKRPTTTTHRIYLALVQIWEQSGKPPSGEITFSYRQLAHFIGRKWWGKKTIDYLQDHLSILSGTEIRWLRSFKARTGTKTLIEDMKIIEGKSFLEHKDFLKSEKTTAQQTVELNRHLVANMLDGNTKPFNFKEFMSISNDSCANLYTLLDNYLSNKNRWERLSAGLLRDELRFAGTRYEHKRNRLEQLKVFKKELDGKKLSSGTLHLNIALCSDGTDYKLIAIRIPNKPVVRGSGKPANSDEDISHIKEVIEIGLEQIRPGRSDINDGVLTAVCRWYPRQMLFDVLGVLKADYRNSIKKSPIKAYMHLVHVEAHRRSMEWINNCGTSCKDRPENRKIAPTRS